MARTARPRAASVARALLLAAVTLPVFLPLLGVEWFESHEAASYPARLVEVRRCWDDGMLSARWFPDLAGGRGYPFLSFYAPLSFWAAGALHRAGLDVPLAWKVLVALSTWLSAAGAYRLARHGTGPSGAFAAAALWAWAPYHIRDLWTRGDLAEYFALAFLPWALFAVLRIARRPDARAAAAAGAAGAAAILSHNVLGLFTGLAMAAAAGIAAATGGVRRTALPLAGAGVLALALSAFFWVPALAEREFVQLDNLRGGYFDVHRNFVAPVDLIGVARPERVFVPGEAEPMTFELGIGLFVALLGPLAWFGGAAGVRRVVTIGEVLLAAGLLFSVSVSAPAYDAVPLLDFVGLPWRFLALASLGVALLAGAAVDAAARRMPRGTGAAAAAGLALAAALTAADLARPLAELELEPWMLDPAAYRQADFTASVADEYLPVTARAREEIPFRGGLAPTGPARIRDVERGVARWSFTAEADAPVTVVLQDFWFPGWEAARDGVPLDIAPRPRSGHAQVDLPAGEHAVTARLGMTPVRRGTAGASAAAAVAATAMLLLRRRREDAPSSDAPS